MSRTFGFSHESEMGAGACRAVSLAVGFNIPFFKLRT